MPTVCILYGFCEGPQVARRFRAMLRDKGYNIVTDPKKADIIIGHSGGCYLVPEKTKAKRIIQIGIPYWPGRSILGSIGHKIITDLSHHHREGEMRFWLRKTFWNSVYFWNIPKNIRMVRARASGAIWRYGGKTTVVRPTLDTFCVAKPKLLPFTEQPKWIKVPGHHDQCWRQPKPYIDIIVK